MSDSQQTQQAAAETAANNNNEPTQVQEKKLGTSKCTHNNVHIFVHKNIAKTHYENLFVLYHSCTEGDELKEAVRKQIEYYFSPQNLANDAFLVSHMNKDLYVGLDLIATFKIMKAMTTDIEVIKKAILDSKVLTLDETGTKVKPNAVSTQQRTTIIIRDLEGTVEVCFYCCKL